MQNARKSRQSGSTILEFAVVVPFIIAPLFWGSTAFGIMLGRYVEAVQACRDITHMLSDGVDFSQTTARNIALKLTAGTGMTDSGGNGVVILSKIQTVFQADCTATGYTVGQCANANVPVFINRITIGQASLRASQYGTPNAAILDTQGNISPSVFMQNTDSTVRANGFEADYDAAVLRALGTAATPPAMNQGDIACVGEIFFPYPDIGFLGSTATGGAYKKFIFRCD